MHKIREVMVFTIILSVHIPPGSLLPDSADDELQLSNIILVVCPCYMKEQLPLLVHQLFNGIN